MPLVLTQNEATASGHDYADELGVAYEYPTRYRGWVQPGERFAYYRGRRRPTGSLEPQVYLGVGVVGQIRPSPVMGRLLCAVEDFEEFSPPVPFKIDGAYLEPLGNVPPERAGLYFRPGVRRINEGTYARILAAAAAVDPTAGTRRQLESMPYATPETARLVDEIAMELAVEHVRAMHPQAKVHRMPHNNPGYDIEMVLPNGTRYVEVKGTKRPLPHFYMSEGERLFADANRDHYFLLVAFSVNTALRTGTIIVHHGSLGPDEVSLRPIQWEGSLLGPALPGDVAQEFS
jgi:Domain of unknown function (DUF3883)